MTDVYKFRVEVKNFEDIIWREIEITSASSVAKLGYAILASLECEGNHLFHIKYKNKEYETFYNDDEIDDFINKNGIEIVNAMSTKLSKLNIKIGDVLVMEYDYSNCWEFEIQLLSITEMKKGTGRRYPTIVNGEGRGIIEEISPCELRDLINDLSEDNPLRKVLKNYDEQLGDWNYKNFDLEILNLTYKNNVFRLQKNYEDI